MATRISITTARKKPASSSGLGRLTPQEIASLRQEMQSAAEQMMQNLAKAKAKPAA